jgi:DNA-binding transcriptional MerR regulator
MIYFSIKELENFSGIKAHTIRTWEQRFHFLQPQRTSKLRRTYSIDELKLLLDISFLNRNGYKVSHLAKMDKSDIEVALSSLSLYVHKRERAINELITCMAAMDTEGFNMVLEECILSSGVDDTIKHVIFPFVNKAGMLQQINNKVYKPNLVLIEQSIKQKIILGIENVASVKIGKTALFFLSKKNSELELLYMQYVLKTKGFSIIFLSNFTSLHHLEIITTAKKPDCIITAMADKKQPFDNKSFLQFLNKELPGTEFYNLGSSKIVEALKERGKIKESEDVEKLIEMILQKTPVETLEKAY